MSFQIIIYIYILQIYTNFYEYLNKYTLNTYMYTRKKLQTSSITRGIFKDSCIVLYDTRTIFIVSSNTFVSRCMYVYGNFNTDLEDLRIGVNTTVTKIQIMQRVQT